VRRLLLVSMLWLMADGVHAQSPAPAPQALEGPYTGPPAAAVQAAPPRLTLEAYEAQLRWRLAALEQQEDDLREAGGLGRRRFRIVGGFVGGGLGLVGGMFALVGGALANADYGDDSSNNGGVGIGGGVAGGLLFGGAAAGFVVAIFTLARPWPYLDEVRSARRARVDTARELQRVVRERQVQLSLAGSGLRLSF
jgi:hypothetical protein